jgi:hypothetical protein
VHKVVFVFQIVVRRAGPDVALLVEVDTEVVGNEGPDTDIKLASVVQKGFLDVLLNDPVLVDVVLLIDELVDVSHIFKNLDAATLVHGCWFDEPHVLGAVLVWYALLVRPSSCQVTEPVHEEVDRVVVDVLRDYERRRRSVEH